MQDLPDFGGEVEWFGRAWMPGFVLERTAEPGGGPGGSNKVSCTGARGSREGKGRSGAGAGAGRFAGGIGVGGVLGHEGSRFKCVRVIASVKIGVLSMPVGVAGIHICLVGSINGRV